MIERQKQTTIATDLLPREGVVERHPFEIRQNNTPEYLTRDEVLAALMAGEEFQKYELSAGYDEDEFGRPVYTKAVSTWVDINRVEAFRITETDMNVFANIKLRIRDTSLRLSQYKTQIHSTLKKIQEEFPNQQERVKIAFAKMLIEAVNEISGVTVAQSDAKKQQTEKAN